MIKFIIYFIMFLIVIIFFSFVTVSYISEKNIKVINSNRSNLEKIAVEQANGLQILKNDTDKVIEYNSGYNNLNIKPKRNFRDLFKK